jgi:hypothetical protein
MVPTWMKTLFCIKRGDGLYGPDLVSQTTMRPSASTASGPSLLAAFTSGLCHGMGYPTATSWRLGPRDPRRLPPALDR